MFTVMMRIPASAASQDRLLRLAACVVGVRVYEGKDCPLVLFMVATTVVQGGEAVSPDEILRNASYRFVIGLDFVVTQVRAGKSR